MMRIVLILIFALALYSVNAQQTLKLIGNTYQWVDQVYATPQELAIFKKMLPVPQEYQDKQKAKHLLFVDAKGVLYYAEPHPATGWKMRKMPGQSVQ